jgi:N-acetylglucosaminyl-diphospho-decaprenol L-rhamnosyltransferase
VSAHVAVVVVAYDSAAVLPGLLASLPEGMAPLSWELVVVDNGSTDGGPDLVSSLAPAARVVRTGRNGGYAAGINAGVAAAAPHDAVLVLNPDVRLAPGCAATLLRVLDEPGTGIAVPRLRDGQGRLIESWRREPTLPRAAADALVGARRAGRWFGEVVTDPTAYDTRQVVDWAEGSTQLISRGCWADVGEWDESYFLFSEETDFGLRARDRGWRTVYVPDADAVHLEGGSDRSPRLWPLVVANRLRLYRRRHRVPAVAAFWTTQVVREASRAALGRAEARAALKVLLSPQRLAASPGPEWLR